MSETAKQTLGFWLVIAAFSLAVIGLGLLEKAQEEAEAAERAAQFTEAFGGYADTDVEPNRTPATIAWVIGGASLFTGVIFLATARPDENR